MKLGKKFEALANAIKEDNGYKLNANGIEMVKKFHSVISEIERVLLPITKTIAKDPNKIAKQSAIQLVSTINSTKEGSEAFDIMTRLDTMTNGGKTPIQGNFTFNQDDKILQYLEKY